MKQKHLKLLDKISLFKRLALSKFPHFKRKFNAQLITSAINFTLWSFLYLCLITNLLTNKIFRMNIEKNLRFAAMKNPKESSSHENLGQYYLSINKEKAQKEYRLAQECYSFRKTSQTNILGVQNLPWQKWTEMATKKERLVQEEKYWKALHLKLPNYIYATLKLASLHYQLGNPKEANKYLKIVLKEDTKNQMALKIAEKLKQ